jgi:signal transduction protein with GAF and PtsI domain
VWRQIFISNGKAIKARTLFLGADKKVHLVPSSEEDFRKMFFKNGGSQ